MRSFFKTEDWLAIWLGFFVLCIAPVVPKVPKLTKWRFNPILSFSADDIFIFLGIFFAVLFIFGLVVGLINESSKKFAGSFVFVSFLSLIALLFSAQVTAKAFGFGYAFWALLIGLLVSNTVGTPDWVKSALKPEFFIKTGLVLLGAEIVFPKMLGLGVPALIVAWGVTPIVLVSMYFLGTKYLKLGKNLSVVIATATSVCGVSAAIAASAACKAKKEDLTLAVGMSMIFTVIMMIVMPMLVKLMDLPPIIGGAWIGGTIDATGAVVASGAVLGQKAMNIAAIVKMIQNIMIGVVAFVIALIWTSGMKNEASKQRVSFFGELWNRLPKFILGFLFASLIFSFILYPTLGEASVKALLNVTKSYRGLFFVLAFVSIGLQSNFKELRSHMGGGKPIVLYLLGQMFNIILTLMVAWCVFGMLEIS